MEKIICKEGIVRKINPNDVTVEIIVSSACGGCNAKALCMMSEQKNELIMAKNLGNETFEIGETVSISMRESLGKKAVLIGYLFPFLVLIIGLFSTYYFSRNELLSIGIGIGLTVLYYLIIRLLNKKIDKQFIFYVSKKN
ncbi:MAG: SoxR reducing system RseC family protein [Bacteroidales bacterium]